MQKLSPLFIMTFLLIMQVALGKVSLRPNGDLDTILNNMQRAAKTVKTIQAGIHQETHFGAIGGQEKYEGEIFFKQLGPNADKVCLKYFARGAVSKYLWVNGDSVVFYQPLIKQAIKTTLSKQAGKRTEFGFIASPYVSVPQLKEKYNVAYLKDESVAAAPAAVLELTPRQASDVTKIVLWVGRKSWLPVQYQVSQRNGDVSTYSLSNMNVNGAIPEKIFVPSVPKDAKTIDQ